MALLTGQQDYSTFVKGLITEANPLSFPENASIDEVNFELLRTGERKRRFGMDYETSHVMIDTLSTGDEISKSRVSSFLWEASSREGEIVILVVQIGDRLFFFDAASEPISAAPLNGGNSIKMFGNPITLMQATAIAGKMIVANGQKGVIVLKYDSDTDTVSTEARILLVRDIWGVEDNVPIGARVQVLYPDHEYNLVNQGWGKKDNDKSGGPLYYRSMYDQSNQQDGWPSNVDLVTSGKDPTNKDIFSLEFLNRSNTGTTHAPRGFFVIEAFRRGAGRESVFTGKTFKPASVDFAGDPMLLTKFLYNEQSWPAHKRQNTTASFPSDESGGGIKAVTSFAGRVWYSGASSLLTDSDIRSPSLGSYVFFSQVVDGDEKISRCYQENDPSSDVASDLLASDGGALIIPDMQNAFKLTVLGRHLIIFAENGIWGISGGETNFSATNFEINKISSVEAISVESIVEVENNLMFWAEEGIYILGADQITNRVGAQNITQDTIQGLYNEITSQAKRYAKGTFDPVNRKLRWLFNSSTSFNSTNFVNNYDTELVFDIVLGAFYKHKIGILATNSPYVASSFISPEFSNVSFLETLTDDTGEQYTTNDGEDYQVLKTAPSYGVTRVKYITMLPSTVDTYDFTVSYYKDILFRDWFTQDGVGVDAAAFLLTGYDLLGSVSQLADNRSTQTRKFTNYITCHFARTESGFEDNGNGGLDFLTPSSCILQAQWDFADSINSGKFGPEQQVYRLLRPYVPTGVLDTFDYGQSVITTKNKLRGRGRALSLLFKTEPLKQLRMFGWGLKFNGVENV